MSKTDFFELPVGDQNRECIEVETDYDRGVMDERKRWESKTCDGCKYFTENRECGRKFDDYITCERHLYELPLIDRYEPKGSE